MEISDLVGTGVQIVHVQAVCSVVLLIAFLIATTVFQQRATMQVNLVLDKLPPPIKATQLFASASRYFARRDIGNLFTSPVHAVPVWFLILVVSLCAFATYFGAEFFSKPFEPKVASYVLGGAYATSEVPLDVLNHYQSGTVFIGSTAFLGAYIWTISQLVNRINNDDMNPVTYYFMSIRILSACLVAGIARHIIEAVPYVGTHMSINVGAEKVPVGLAVLGFLIGWNPSLWINELLLKAGDFIKSQIPSQRWPERKNLPLNLTLLMLQGMVPDTIDRLNELNIDNCQKLASENPVIIWIRTSYTLELVVDWIAQAQLAIRFEQEALQMLRTMGIRDIFSYRAAIDDAASLKVVSANISVAEPVLVSHLQAIDACPEFARLAELRASLLPQCVDVAAQKALH